MYQGGVVGWLTIPLGGFEANLFCRTGGGLIETVSQTLHYAYDSQFAGRFENHLEDDFTLDP